MQILNTSTSLPSSPFDKLALYSGLDVLALFEIKDGLLPLMDEHRLSTYNFEMELQAPLLSMSFAGLPVDESARREMAVQFSKEQVQLTSVINQMLEAIGYFDYYRSMAVLEFSAYAPGIDLPTTWTEWLELPLQTRRALKEAAPEALATFQKAIKEFSEPFNPNSPAQKLRLFYHFFGSPVNTTALPYFIPPPWLKTHGIPEYKSRNVKGDYTPAVDREALEKIIKAAGEDKLAATIAAPFAHVCLAISDLSKSLGFLNCKLEHGLFKSSFGAVTETGRLASRQNAQGYGCFIPHAEALTKSGWKYLEDIQDGELVMQYDHGILLWAPAIPYKTEVVNGEIFCVQTEQTGFTVTPDHRLLCMPYSGEFYTYPQTALGLFKESRSKLILSGKLNGDLVLPRIIVALLADGSLEYAKTNYWRIGFAKARKITRFKVLCAEAGIEYHELSIREDHHIRARFSLNAPSLWPTSWGDWILQLSQETIKLFLAELGHWDGSFRGNSTMFCTAKHTTAVWVQTLAHLGGMAATITNSPQSLMSYSTTLMYKVNIRPRKFAIVENKHKEILPYTGPVYCLTVPSSYFLVRQHGKIFVTGNSNGQNVTPKLRHIFTAPPGEKFIVCDYAQIESRIVAAICFRLFGLENYIAGTESGDLHSLAASMVWPDLPWPEDFKIEWCIKHGAFPKDLLKAAKKLASAPFYRGKSRRDVSKTLGHGCLTADHEVLTPIGWVPIHTKPDIIMQSDGTFASVTNWIDKDYSGRFVLWEGLSISLCMTDNHRVYYSTKGDALSVKYARNVPSAARIPLNLPYKGGPVNEIYARLLAAYHCDGHYPGYNQTEFHFNKPRKILRLHKLAFEAGIEIVPRADNTKVILKWRPEIHAPCWGMLQWDKESLVAYMDELKYWDGWTNGVYISLFSKNREWLEVWQTFNRLLGNGGNIQKPQISGFGTEMHCLQVNNRRYASRASFTVDCTKVTDAQVYCPTVPKESFYVRRNGKICITGNSSYCGKPPQMSKQSHIEVKLVEHYQEVFFAAFPEIAKWHRWVAEQVQTTGEITTMLGRTRRFFGRPNDDATIREAVAYEPQSVAADYCNKALLRLHNMGDKFPGVIRLSKHDELVVSCLESLEEPMLAIMREQMEEMIVLKAPNGKERNWFVPAEAESGWNLGRKSEINPNGISHPLDGRTRVVAGGWQNWKL